jgi:hypothetical protein
MASAKVLAILLGLYSVSGSQQKPPGPPTGVHTKVSLGLFIPKLGLLNIGKWVYRKWVYSTWQYSLTRFSNIFKNSIHLPFSGLGTMTGTTGHVFPFLLHPISSKSDGCGPTFEVSFWFFRTLFTTKISVQHIKSAMPIYYIPIS